MDIKKDRDRNKQLNVTEKEIPKKMSYFNEFIEHMKAVILQGTQKYTGAEKDKAETIDIMPMVVGEQGYLDFIICDVLKRLIRFRNDRRERDLVKIAVWMYLIYNRLNLKFFEKQKPLTSEEMEKIEKMIFENE